MPVHAYVFFYTTGYVSLVGPNPVGSGSTAFFRCPVNVTSFRVVLTGAGAHGISVAGLAGNAGKGGGGGAYAEALLAVEYSGTETDYELQLPSGNSGLPATIKIRGDLGDPLAQASSAIGNLGGLVGDCVGDVVFGGGNGGIIPFLAGATAGNGGHGGGAGTADGPGEAGSSENGGGNRFLGGRDGSGRYCGGNGGLSGSGAVSIGTDGDPAYSLQVSPARPWAYGGGGGGGGSIANGFGSQNGGRGSDASATIYFETSDLILPDGVPDINRGRAIPRRIPAIIFGNGYADDEGDYRGATRTIGILEIITGTDGPAISTSDPVDP